MKRIYNIGWIISGILLLTGCDISNRDNNLSESLVYFINEGENDLVLYNTGEDFTYTMPIFKSGLLNEEANVALSVDSKLIEQYNKDNKTTSKLLPAEYYQIVKSKQTMDPSQQKANFQVVFLSLIHISEPTRPY